MKKFLKVFILIFAVSIVSVSNVYAIEDNSVYTYVEETFDDGSYIEITIDNGNSNTRATKTKSKTATYKGEDGTAMWSVTVKGTFTYNGSTLTCTSSSVSTSNYSTTWKLSNATASASVKATQYHSNGTTLRAINKTVKLTGDKNGNLS